MKWISNVLSEKKPDIVIHLGAMTGVDLCETQQDLCIQNKLTSNAEILAKECSKMKFIHGLCLNRLCI